MPYAVKQVSPEIVEVAYRGLVAVADTTNATNECVELQRRLSILKFLVIVADDAEMEMRPEQVRAQAGEGYRRLELRRTTCIAIVQPKSESARGFVDAFEQTCRKLGWNVRVLPDRAAAVKWLDTPDRPPRA